MDQFYSWKEENGSWQRNMGSMETFYLSLAAPEGQPVHWMIGSGVSIAYRGDDDVDVAEALKQAWRRVRHDLPSVGATVDLVNQRLVVGPDDDVSVEAWLQSSFRVHDGITADQLFSGFKSRFSITLHFLRGTNELVMQAMHALLDGRGMLYLFDALFKRLSRPGDAHAAGGARNRPNLTRPLDEWLGLSQSPSRQNVEDAQVLFRRLVQDKPVGLAGVDLGLTPARPAHKELCLSEKDTQRIVDACKSKGITVTTAWHAAVATAIQVRTCPCPLPPPARCESNPAEEASTLITATARQKIQSEEGEAGTTYAQFTTIDLRRWFPAPFDAEQHSVGSLQTALPFVVDLGEDSSFDSIAERLQRDYKKPFAFAHDDLGCLVPGMAMYRRMLAGGHVPPSSTPYLSSMGVVDDFVSPRYGGWEIAEYWVSSTMLTADFQVYLWTWRGQMVLSACYNEAFYEAARVGDVLGAVRHEMEKGLGVWCRNRRGLTSG
ncbi:uncharacterized protein MAM_01362 [Metarhizium album ARSEF 1941]|uniref:Uncharacterized protein n=1 Tax=Metarhizium album (strain ARSEF 1941) TaxID=1081103 RepID=A0A0B2X2Q6_METAS|nr:uncharacterized protein MAM_01362 [Metarhizium album ARSEF 1941]KHO00584.1 hypothetical protein MAM_01362 [Metarhizium album ARSEF 1941]